MKKTIMSILTVWVMVCSVFVGLIGFGGIENVKAPYTTHDPIRINNNTEFVTMAGLEGWIGDGSPGSPYIIEGYDINGSGYGYCIYIGNTTVYFEVNDSYLHEASGVGSFPYYTDSGIILYNVQNGTIANNTVSNNDRGIFLSHSNINIITNNTGSSNDIFGIFLYYSSNITISNNIAFPNNWVGIALSYSSNNTISNNTASSNNVGGIVLYYSDNNTIINNTASNNDYGIDLCSSNNNTVVNNNASNNGYGIKIWSEALESRNNTIENNTASMNYWSGIKLQHTSNNTIANNTFSSNDYGIDLFESTSNTITNNEMLDNGIYIMGDLLVHWNTHFIDTTNTVSSKPVRYWKNQTGGSVPLGAGQVIIANCTNVVVENQNMGDCSVGIHLGFSINNTITNNTITNNNLSDNLRGIYLYKSNSNTIVNNTALRNDYGIFLWDSNSNKVYHNNFIGNTIQAYEGANSDNQWDNGYPSGGNYWSDFDEPSEGAYNDYMGPDQNILGRDNLVDNGTIGGGGKNPYIIDSDSQDNYPLISYNRNLTILYEGWNLISIPLIQSDTNLGAVLSSITDSYDSVWRYNAINTSDFWKVNNTSKPSSLIDFNSVDHTIGFWIHITEPGGVLFEYPGTQPTQNQSITLFPGWNMVGYPSLISYNRTKALNNLTFSTHVDSIWTYDAETSRWDEIGPSEYFEVGRGYWIHAKTKCEWEVPL